MILIPHSRKKIRHFFTIIFIKFKAIILFQVLNNTVKADIKSLDNWVAKLTAKNKL